MTRRDASSDTEESEERIARTWWCRRAVPWALCLAVLAPSGVTDAGDRGGSKVRLDTSQSLSQAALLQRGRARGAGKLRELRTEMVRLREELARLDVDPSPDRIGRARTHRQAITRKLAEAVASAPRPRTGQAGLRVHSRRASPTAPSGPVLEEEVESLMSEIDQVLVDPVGQGARLELVRRRLSDALRAPTRRGGSSSDLAPAALKRREVLRR
jgi:hypothetical protein